MTAKSSHKSGILRGLALKLGIDADKVLLKASEISRLLQLKTVSNGKSLQHISDTCRNVLCLDLAATTLGETFDRDIAISYAGVKKKAYMNGYYMFEKILGLEQQVTIKNLCIQQGCSEVIEFAEDILKRYVEEHSKGAKKHQPLDLEHPMYPAFAVYSACRHRKIKINKQKLIEISRIKKVDFERVTSEMSKVISETDLIKKARKRKSNLMDLVEEHLKESQDKKQNQNDEDNDNENNASNSDYESWKKRMLAEASEEL